MKVRFWAVGISAATVVAGAIGAVPQASVAAPAPPCAATETSVYPSSVANMDGGGKLYTFVVDGVQSQLPVPPAGFRPEQAAAADLARYGFPPRPQDSAERQHWSEIMRDYQRTPAPAALCVEDVTTLPQAPAISNVSVSNNWSGFVASPNTSWVAVEGDFNHPSNLSDTCARSLDSSWVGLGGFQDGLIQAGTASHSDYYSLPHRAWEQ